jgi:hypothetical protein
MDNQFEKKSEHKEEFRNSFLDGNELIEEAIANFYKENNQETFINILETIRHRMHADGHFIFPVLTDENDPERFAFCTIQSNDGKVWQAAFTSQEEFEKGEKATVISYFIDSALKSCLDTDNAGIIINPWGQAFLLEKGLIEDIFRADGDTEYSVPDDQITAELLEDGSFLKKATEICNRNSTQLNMIKLLRILRDSYVWVPCNAILSDADYAMIEKMAKDAESGEGLDSLKGQQFTTMDNVRLVPDILQNGDAFFFPVFTSAEEMGEYGDHFSKVEKHFLETIVLARNNEKDVTGIVINAFSEPFVVNKELFELIEGMESSLSAK